MIINPPDGDPLATPAFPNTVIPSQKIVSDIESTHQSLPPEHQDAIDHAMGIVSAGNLPVKPAPAPPVAPPAVGSAVSPAPQIGSVQAPQSSTIEPPEPSALPIMPTRSAVAPAVKTPAQQELSRVQSTGSGVSQIKNPLGRIAGTIGDVIASGIFPRFGQMIPGTTAHHQLVEHGLEKQVNDEAAQQKEQDAEAKNSADIANESATAAHTQAETTNLPITAELQKAETANYISEAEARKNPDLQVVSHPVIDPSDPSKAPRTGYFNKKTGAMTYGPEIAAAPTADKTAASVHVLPDGTVISVSHDQKSGKSTADVVYKGDPKEAPPKIVQLEKNGKPHQVLVKEDGTEIKDLGETGEKPPVVNVNAGTAALDRESTHYAKPHEKAISDAGAQLDKIDDARSMINGSAEAQALGIPKVLTALVSGQGSGVRITQPELNAIGTARGIGGDVEGFLKSISGKGKLTSTQQSQLTGLLDSVKERILQKQAIAKEALDSINGGRSRDEIIAADKTARDKLSDFEKHAASASAPPRPAGIPANAQFDPATRHWKVP